VRLSPGVLFADHMAGLASFKTKDRTIYCSRTTRDLVVRHFPQVRHMCYSLRWCGELHVCEGGLNYLVSILIAQIQPDERIVSQGLYGRISIMRLCVEAG
jgi:hypothetical protein